MPLSHLIAKGAALLACVGMGLMFIRLGVLGVARKRLPMRVGEVRGRGAVALGAVYVAFGTGLVVFGVALVRTPIR